MISRTMQAWTGAGAAALLVVGGVTAASMDKAVALSVDGTVTDTHVFGSTVGDLLSSEGITLAEGDIVSPDVAAPLADGDTVTVKYSRPLTVTIDGKTTVARTTETTVSAALAALGLSRDGATMSVSRSASIGRDGLSVDLVTPKKITLKADGKTVNKTINATTVGDALGELGVKVGKADRLKPASNTALTGDTTITLQRVTTETKSSTSPVAFSTVRTKTSDLYVGETKVKTAGVNGVRTTTTTATLVDGKVEKTAKGDSKVTKAPVDQVVLVGTKARPAPKPVAKKSSSSSSSTSTSTAGLNLARSAMWDRVAACESGNRWNINTGNGYYGGLQFSYSTWLAYGGGQFAQRADLASRAQQITVANRVYADNGLAQWGCKA